MKNCLSWAQWSLIYLVFGAVVYAASKGDPVALYVLPSLCIIRVIGLVFVSFIMDSSWYEARPPVFICFCILCETLVFVAVFSLCQSAIAYLGLLALALYEFARLRVRPFTIRG